jgi:hypothetical protein
MINDCIIKICNLPIDFKNNDKSAFVLASESNFRLHNDKISTSDIKEYLKANMNLLEIWQQWSWDKRTTGYFLSFEDNNTVGFINEKHQTTYKKEFDSSIDSCSEFIYREISSILRLENSK